MEIIMMLLPIIIIVLALIFFKPLTGFILIPKDKIGLIEKKFRLFGGRRSLDGGIIAYNGEAGYQAQILSTGWYLFKWFWKYSIKKIEFTEIPVGKIGLVNAKDGLPLQQGRILSIKDIDCDNFQDAVKFLKNGGEKGKQAKFLNSGVYKINKFLFDIDIVDIMQVKKNFIGIVTTYEGIPIPAGEIAGESDINAHKSFSDAKSFVESGGYKGLQSQVIQSGSYAINPWFASIEEQPMTVVPIGHVGVVISYVGKKGADISGTDFSHGNIVKNGEKGVWEIPLDPNKYAINPYTTKVENVQTTNIVLNWANGKNEAHKLDEKLSTITVRSKDGFPFNLDVSQIIHIPQSQASRVISRFGSVLNLVSQVLEPTIGNYFRNSAQNADAISFIQTRVDSQSSAKEHITKALETYNIIAVDTLIGDINPPEALMKTLTDRKIANEQQITFSSQKEAEVTRQSFVKQKAEADIQPSVVQAEQSVRIAEKNAEAEVKRADGVAKATVLTAEANAKKITVEATATAGSKLAVGTAEATVIEKIGQANAKAYEEQAKAIGKENLTSMKVAETVSLNHLKIVPEIVISGQSGGGGALEGLLAMNMINTIKGKTEEKTEPQQKK